MENTNEKKWGLYNTYDPEYVEYLETLHEAGLWHKMNLLSNKLFWAYHDGNKPWRKDESFDAIWDAQYNLEYLMYLTRRFGVEFSREPSATEHIEQSESLNAWFNFWKKYFDDMDPTTYDEFFDAYINHEDISKYMPKCSWKDSLEKKPKSKKKKKTR